MTLSVKETYLAVNHAQAEWGKQQKQEEIDDFVETLIDREIETITKEELLKRIPDSLRHRIYAVIKICKEMEIKVTELDS